MNIREQNQLNESLSKLQERGDIFTRRIIHERRRATELQAQLREAYRKITFHRNENKRKAMDLLNMHTNTSNDAYKRADGLNPTRLAGMNQKKLLKNMEGRLNKALLKRNEVENENNRIRAKIDKVRVKICQDHFNRLMMERRLKAIQAQMNEIMEKASVASEQRDKLVDQRNQIIYENSEEKQDFNDEYQRLGKYVVNQNELLEQSISAAASAVVHLAEKAKGETSPVEEETMLLEQNLADLRNRKKENEQLLEQIEESTESYQESFDEMKKVSGLTSTDDIVKEFVEQEEESFSIFSYIQRLSHETDILVEQQTHIQQDIGDYTKDQTDKENHRINVMHKYKAILNEAKEERIKLNEIALEGKRAVETIAKKVQSLYIKLRCSVLDPRVDKKRELDIGKQSKKMRLRAESFLPTLLNCQGVSERNILHSMELIEKRSIQLISAYAIHLSKNLRGRRPSLVLTPKVFERVRAMHTGQEGLRQSLDIEESELSDSDSSDSDGSNGVGHHPMSMNELRRQEAAKHNQ
mmetsp:Transcript_630/g.869  ORF Transcript_630/g.869 Transcript_630/m.869 type:complete len:526 (-) Transcript_630:174-1751(-)|eukprot:CAMPEP_0116025454 /NCGR_PEP_ID=MMETSP0321-20121206/13061_1 /TAXON_ID=163516 /ORGANISM="Leptocylindrus danicus var. danicus, Strain B650" /LENGTH=525 /DNA_ID=CAMNT_0003497657 /DNA_START=274 /DNA_END=1851 /DNA_ORIENTATION=-